LDSLCDDRIRLPCHRIELKCEVARLAAVVNCRNLALTPSL
jgi:hypothetical protein